MLGQFTRQQQTDGSLDFSAGDGRAAVVVSQTGSLGSDALEDVIHEGVHDGHRLGADAGVGMHLLQHLVDVDGVRLPPPAAALLVSAGTLGLGLRRGLLRSLTRSFGRHNDLSVVIATKSSMIGSLCPETLITDPLLVALLFYSAIYT